MFRPCFFQYTLRKRVMKSIFHSKHLMWICEINRIFLLSAPKLICNVHFAISMLNRLWISVFHFCHCSIECVSYCHVHFSSFSFSSSFFLIRSEIKRPSGSNEFSLYPRYRNLVQLNKRFQCQTSYSLNLHFKETCITHIFFA